jgi:hypothetical protein
MKSGTSQATERLFMVSAAMLLFVTGMAKTISIFGSSKLLTAPDPITNMPFGYLMLTVGLLEIGIGAACWLKKSGKWPLVLVAWLATNFLVYRVGLWWIGWQQPCGCLGSLTDALKLSPEAADSMMKAVLAYLLVGSYALLIRDWRRARPGDRSMPMRTGAEATRRIQA